jgi:hypothetical protein
MSSISIYSCPVRSSSLVIRHCFPLFTQRVSINKGCEASRITSRCMLDVKHSMSTVRPGSNPKEHNLSHNIIHHTDIMTHHDEVTKLPRPEAAPGGLSLNGPSGGRPSCSFTSKPSTNPTSPPIAVRIGRIARATTHIRFIRRGQTGARKGLGELEVKSDR